MIACITAIFNVKIFLGFWVYRRELFLEAFENAVQNKETSTIKPLPKSIRGESLCLTKKVKD
jgi:hypothetical protein